MRQLLGGVGDSVCLVDTKHAIYPLYRCHSFIGNAFILGMHASTVLFFDFGCDKQEESKCREYIN